MSTTEIATTRRAVELGRVRASVLSRACRRLMESAAGIEWRWRLAGFGAGACLDRPAKVVGGESIVLGPRVRVWSNSRIEALNARRGITRVSIGEGTVIQPFVHIGAADRVRIGRKCLFASRVYITDHDHDFSDPRECAAEKARVVTAPVDIGDSVWLGEGVMVLKGVSIGCRSIVGAGSVVTKSLPSYTVAVGNPARVIQQWSDPTGEWVAVEP